MDFYLVQRFMRGIMHKGPITKPEHLGVDYMGSSEFEFGAIPKAYKAMQGQKLGQTTVKVKAFDTEATFHVIAPTDQASSLQGRFQAWFDRNLRSKENPYLDRAISRKRWNGETISDDEAEQLPVAWWSLTDNIFFSLDESVAKMWLESMANREPALLTAGPMTVL